jgi:hypothetical protein
VATRLESAVATAKIQDGNLWLKSVTLAAGADAATVIIDDSTDGSGTDLLKLAAPAGETATWVTGDRGEGVFIGNALYATITGTTPFVSFEFEQ